MTPRFDLFLSHARADDARLIGGQVVRPITELREWLEKHRHPRTGARFRAFMDVQDLELSRDGEREIRDKLKECGALAVVCSHAAVRSAWVGRELGWFVEDQPEATVLGVALEIRPGDAFPAYFAPNELGADIVPGDRELAARWRERLALASHKLVAAVWGLPLEDVHDRFEADERAEQARLGAREALERADDDPERAAELALAAHRLADVPETASAVRTVAARWVRFRRAHVLPPGATLGSDGHAAAVVVDGEILVRSLGEGLPGWSVPPRPGPQPRRCVHVEDLARGRVLYDGDGLVLDRRGRRVAFRRSIGVVVATDDGQRLDLALADGELPTRVELGPGVVIVGGSRGAVTAFDAAGRQRWSASGPAGPVRGIALFGDQVAFIHDADVPTLEVRSLDDGELRWSQTLGAAPTELVSSADGRELVIACADGSVACIDPADPSERRVLASALLPPVRLAMGPGGRLAAGDRSGRLLFRDERARPAVARRSPVVGGIRQLGFSADADVLAVLADDGAVGMVDVARDAALGPAVRAFGGATGIAVRRDEGALVSVHRNGVVAVWDGVRPLRVFGKLRTALRGERFAVAVDGSVFLAHPGSLEPADVPLGPFDARVVGHALSADGATLALALSDRSLRLWDPVRRTPASDPVTCGSAGTFSADLAFSSDGRRLAVSAWVRSDGGLRHELDVREVAAWRAEPIWRSDAGRCAGWSGDLLLVASKGRVTVFDASGEVRGGVDFGGDREPVVACSDGSELWAAACGDRIHVRRRDDPSDGATLRIPEDEVSALALADDGCTLAVGTERGVVTLHDAGTGAALGTVAHLASGVRSFLFAGTDLVCSDGDGRVCTRSVALGESVLALERVAALARPALDAVGPWIPTDPHGALDPADDPRVMIALQRAIVGRRYAEAGELGRQGLAAHPRSLRAAYGVALGSWAAGAYRDALAQCERILVDHPGDLRTRVLYALALQHLGRTSAALAELARAPLGSYDPIVQYDRGNLLLCSDHPGAALVFLDRAVELAPDLPEARIERASALLALGRARDALPEIERAGGAQATDPHVVEVHVRVLAAVGRIDEALARCTAALAGHEAALDAARAAVGRGDEIGALRRCLDELAQARAVPERNVPQDEAGRG